MEFVFITDTHFRKSSNVRTDEDYLKSLCDKLQFVVDCANKWNATLIIGGDLFDTPSQPDLVKTAVIQVLMKCSKKPISISGNHDILFNNRDNNYKTSIYCLHAADVLRLLSPGEDSILVEGEQKCKIAVTRPMKDCGLPQLGVFHGFLNKEDGINTFLFEDVPQNDRCCICLGHDHVPYEPIKYNNSVIYRTGAMVRAIRNDSEDRIPQLLRIRLTDKGTWATKLYDIPCKDSSLIFKTKKAKAVKRDSGDYSQIIEQIRQVSEKEITFMSAIEMVANSETADYVRDVYNTVQSTAESK